MNDLGVSRHVAREDIHNPDKTIDPIHQSYRDLCEWSNYHPYSDVFRSMRDFDSFFNDMEQKMRNRSEDVYFYSKQTHSCTNKQ